MKIKLVVAELHVEAFAVAPRSATLKGTVHAQSEPTYTVDFPYSNCLSDNWQTYEAQCPSREGYQTCNHTVCDCDQDAQTLDC